MRRAALGLAALALAGCPQRSTPAGPAPPAPVDAAASARPPPTPPDGLRLPAGVAPTSYRLALAIDPERPEFTGTVDIDLAIAAPADAIWLHAAALAIDQATLALGGGAPRPVAIVDDAAHERIGLDAGAAIAAGPATVHLAFRGTLVDDDPIGLFRQREGGRWYAFSQAEGLFARRMTPCFDEPGWKVPWQVTVTAPAGAVVLANAPEAARTPTGDGGVRVEFAPTPPMPSYLLALAVGPFELIDAGVVGRARVPLRIATVAGQGGRAADAARVAPAVIDALEAYFDRPLPPAKLDLVAVPVFFGAMENLGLVTASSAVLLPDPARPSRVGLRELRSLVAHELAHQWFGDLVTPAWWDDLWLNESFATWMAAKVLRQLDPRDDAIAAARRASERAMAADALPSALPLRRPIAGDADVDDSFDAIAYEKGAALLAMFERRLGPERFRTGVRAYLAAHADGNATAADFVAALATASESEAAAAFASFLDHPGTPEVAISLDCTGPTPAVVAAITSGRGPAPWTLPLCVRFPDVEGRAGERCGWIPPGGGRLELPGCPAWVIGNADGAGYYRVRYPAPLADALRANLRRIAVAERVGLAADLIALARTGGADARTFPAWIDALLATRDRHDAVAAVELAGFLGRFADGELSAPWRSWVRAHFGAAARRGGLAAKGKGETVAATSARRSLAYLVGVGGRDPALARDARTRVEAWLAGGADPGDERGLWLTIAAVNGDRALYDRIAAAAAATADREVRGALIDALAAFTDPDSIARNRELFVGRTFEAREALALVVGGLGSADGDGAAWAGLVAHHDQIVALMSALDRPGLIEATGARCTPAARAEVAGFFGPRVAGDARGGRALTHALEQIDQCVSDRAKQREALRAVLGVPSQATSGAGASAASTSG